MRIHVFNPDHDMALEANKDHFTSPHAGRCLRHDLGYLPALWADEGDLVLVDDVAVAHEGFRHLGLPLRGRFVDVAELSRCMRSLSCQGVSVWGWDRSVRHFLASAGVPDRLLPDNAFLNVVRLLSHRGWAAQHVLPVLSALPGMVGEVFRAESVDDVKLMLRQRGNIVVKAPWSSSGRGVRYLSYNVESHHPLTPQLEKWIERVLIRQGCMTVEPYYNKVLDFGMEFISDGVGHVSYRGLSLFNTRHGAYTGNVVDTEARKSAWLSRYVPCAQQNAIRQTAADCLSDVLGHLYRGPLGIDMMVVRQLDSLAVHPCVEMNLRRTMGHVALALPADDRLPRRLMRMDFAGKYRLSVMPWPDVQD